MVSEQETFSDYIAKNNLKEMKKLQKITIYQVMKIVYIRVKKCQMNLHNKKKNYKSKIFCYFWNIGRNRY